MDWSSVGGDPAPGNPSALRAVASKETQLADLLGTVSSDLGGMGHELGAYNWTGPAAHAIHGRLVATIPPLQGLRAMYLDGSRALGAFAANLESWQSQAAALLAKYQAASGDLRRHSADASSADSQVRGLRANVAQLQVEVHTVSLNPLESGAQRADLHSRLSQAQSDLADAQGVQSSAHAAADAARAEMARIQHAIDTIRDEHKTGAIAVTNAILTAAGLSAPDSNPFVNFAGDVMKDLKNFVSSDGFQAFLGSLDTVSAEVGMVAVVVSWIPVVGEVAAGTATVLSVIDVAGHAARAANGDEPWGGVALQAALIAVPMGAGKGAKLLSSDAKGFEQAGALENAKRAIWYDDAATSTGYFRNGIHVVPQLDKVPPAVGQTYEIFNTGLQFGGEVKSVIDGVTPYVNPPVNPHAVQPSQGVR